MRISIMKSGVRKYLPCVYAIRSNINLNKDIKVPGWNITIFLIAPLFFCALQICIDGVNTLRERSRSRAPRRVTFYDSIPKNQHNKRNETQNPISSFIVFRVLSFSIPRLRLGVYYWIYSNCILNLTANNFSSLNDWRARERERNEKALTS